LLLCTEHAGGDEMVWASKMLAQSLALRAKYVYVKPSLKERATAEPLPEPSNVHISSSQRDTGAKAAMARPQHVLTGRGACRRR
jgi:hypothetical protein